MPADRPIHQPIHPDIADRLLEEYAVFHNEHIAHTHPTHLIPWDPAIRLQPPVLGGSRPLEVGSVADIRLGKCTVRVFSPDGTPPESKWPVFLFFHGGGWTLGSIDTENAFCTVVVTRATCVVVAVDYRLAPEDPYPAAVEDAVEALRWVHDKGEEMLGVDPTRLAVGGSSSGANLAAVVAHKAAMMQPPIKLTFQLLMVPVVDNTASLAGDSYPSWRELENTVALTPAKMLWYRNMYLPNKEDWTRWDSSPIFAPDESFKLSPPAWICVSELDILRDEGIAYGKKLEESGVSVEMKVYKGSPHPIMAMDGVLEVGKQLVSDAAEALAKALGRT